MPRRSLGMAALVFSLAVLVGCVGTQPGKVPDSMSSYDRTFDAAVGALDDQRMTIAQQDRRQGVAVGTLGDISITATLNPMFDGTIRVLFALKDDTPAGADLLKRVTDAYNQRMGQQTLLPNLKL